MRTGPSHFGGGSGVSGWLTLAGRLPPNDFQPIVSPPRNCLSCQVVFYVLYGVIVIVIVFAHVHRSSMENNFPNDFASAKRVFCTSLFACSLPRLATSETTNVI